MSLYHLGLTLMNTHSAPEEEEEEEWECKGI